MGFLAVNEYITEIDLSSMLSKRLTLGALALPLLAANWCGLARAAELGEVKVNSFLGQQLSADIELVDLTAADLAEIQAKLAHPDVFKGAGLNVSPVLSGLYVSVAKRDNRRFLHLTTLQPVNIEGLHLFLELSSGGRQIIRAATLWLTPEPPAQRAARTAAAAAATPAAAPMPAQAQAQLQAPAAPPASAATPPAGTSAMPSPSTPPQPSTSRPALPSPAPLAKPAAAASSEAGLSAAAERAFAARKQVAAAAPKPAKVAATLPPARVDAAPAAPAANPGAAPQTCAPAQVEAQAQQCQAMTGKLIDLEGKVQRLQQALAAPAAAAAPAASAAENSHASVPASAQASAPASASASASAATSAASASAQDAAAPSKPGAKPAQHEPAPSKPGAKPSKPGVSPELEGKSRNKWLMLGGGILAGLAALGGLVYYLRKRKDQGPLKIWQSFRKKEEPAAAEPTLEEATTQEQ